MKKVLITAMVGLFMLGIASTASAIVIPPNAVSLGATVPGGDFVAELVDIPFTGVDAFDNVYFTGLLTQTIYRNDIGLLFTYEFSNDESSINSIQSLSTTDFSGFLTDVEVDDEAGWLLRRTNPSTVLFISPNGIANGTSSPLLWIQTDANYYTRGSTVLQDGGNARIHTYAPSAVPEPTSMLLFGMGVLGLIGLGRKKA